MGTHSAETPAKWREALYWAVAHRRKLLAVALVTLPLVSHFAPGFPTDEVLSVVRSLLGA